MLLRRLATQLRREQAYPAARARMHPRLPDLERVGRIRRVEAGRPCTCRVGLETS